MSIFSEIERGIEAVLSPMLAVNSGGYLKIMRRFRGSAAEFDKFYADLRPCGFLGLIGSFQLRALAGHYKDLDLPIAVTFLDDSRRGDQARAEGSGVSGESPGLYQMLEDATALLDGAALRMEGQNQPLLVEVTGGGMALDDKKNEMTAVINARLTIPHYRFTTELKRAIGIL